MIKNKNLTPEQKIVLFKEGTEAPGSSKLNNEKREGSYHCTNCEEKLFESNAKYESGSGWPSFFKKCGGHHGHIFDDGPQPTGKRYCNNGICLIFKAKI